MSNFLWINSPDCYSVTAYLFSPVLPPTRFAGHRPRAYRPHLTENSTPCCFPGARCLPEGGFWCGYPAYRLPLRGSWLAFRPD